MDSEIILKEVNGEILTSSRDVAERFGKKHAEVLYAIEGRVDPDGTIKNNGLLMSGISQLSNLFIKTEYKDSMNRTKHEYLMNRDGFSLLAMGFTGSEALKWKLQYIDAFNKMETKLKEQNTKMLPATYKEALLQLVQQLEENEILIAENEKLTEGIDRYQRFLCEKTGTLKKSDLARKLDVSFQRLASVLKKNGVYTPTSKVKQDFLDEYPNLKLIVEVTNTYKDDFGEEHKKSDWAWTYEGAKAVVDYLVNKGMITYTDNDGFKLKKA